MAAELVELVELGGTCLVKHKTPERCLELNCDGECQSADYVSEEWYFERHILKLVWCGLAEEGYLFFSDLKGVGLNSRN